MHRICRCSVPAKGVGTGSGRARLPGGLMAVLLLAWLWPPTGQAAEPPASNSSTTGSSTTGSFTTRPPATTPTQPPSVNKPVQRPAAPVQTGPQFVREPVVRPPGQTSPELTRLRQQLQQTEQTLSQLRDKRDSVSELSQQDAQQLQQLMDRKAQLEQRISDLLKQQSDSTQSIIDNIK